MPQKLKQLKHESWNGPATKGSEDCLYCKQVTDRLSSDGAEKEGRGSLRVDARKGELRVTLHHAPSQSGVRVEDWSK